MRRRKVESTDAGTLGRDGFQYIRTLFDSQLDYSSSHQQILSADAGGLGGAAP